MQAEALGRRIGVGANAEVFEYGEDKVIKLFYNRQRGQDIESELKRTQAVWNLGLPVPQPHGIVEIGERPGLVMERIPGVSFAEILFTRSDPEVLRIMAQLIHRVHSIPPEQARATGLRSPKAWLAWSTYSRGDLSNEEKRLIIHTIADLPDTQQVCHSDFHMLNVMMRGNEPVIIDWQGAYLGDAGLDVMWLLLILRYAVVPETMMPPEVVQSFYTNRAAFEQVFLEEYCGLSGKTPEQIEQWFLPCAVVRLNTDLLPAERDPLLAELHRRTALLLA